MADKLDSILKSYVADGTATKDKLLGAAFVVVSKDGPIYQGAAGRTRVDPAPAPFTPSSVTWLSSASKLMTALTVMHLLAALPVLRGFTSAAAGEEGKGEERPVLEPNEAAVTLRQLLTHTAGLGIDVADPELARWSRWAGRTDDVNCCTVEGWSTPFKFPPGEGWYYGTGPDWAGQALERVAGARLGRHMDQHVLGPLALRGTTGAADYGRVMQELLRALAGEEGTVVRRETAQEMFRPQLDEKLREWLSAIVWTSGSAAEVPRGSRIDHGLGGILVLEDVEGRRRKGTMFFSGMCNTRWWIDPETGIGAVMLVNVIPYGDSAALALFDELERAVYRDLVPAWEASK
ncbi:beta-lactamase/transpeptidase-like protein [Thermothelomyces heterothallicus CBS 202.75]|uniref:beta-lactamase/transpeptidase-like protein n=1 Tax=Thermothelomyces heterothallicus CBS 202.75 TaxID=1149848 RepID=UPI00374315AC